jgi:hypothetical protein
MDIDFRETLYLIALFMCVGSVVFCNRAVQLQSKLLQAMDHQIDLLHKQVEIEHNISEITDSRLSRVEDIAFPTRTGPHVH